MKTNTFLRIPIINQLRYILLFSAILLGTNATGQNVYSVLIDQWINNNWQKSTETINTYDGSNYLTHSISYNWIASPPPGAWQNAYQVDYANNPDGTVQQSVFQSWDTGSSMWQNIQRSTYTYNAAKKVLTNTAEMWLISYWLNNTLETNTYDSNGYLTQTLNQTWNYTGPWKNSSKIDYSNNASGLVTQSVSQIWNASNVWVNDLRDTYTYTGGNKVLTVTNEHWNGSAWVNSTLLTNTYNGAGFVTVALSQNWNGSAWVNDTQSLYSYNGSNNITQIISQTWGSGTSTWTNATRITFGYSLAADEFTAGKKLVVYPNPSSDAITIMSDSPLFEAEYFITDQTGRIVKKGLLNDAETTIDISQMARGLYFFRIDENYKNSIKILKR